MLVVRRRQLDQLAEAEFVEFVREAVALAEATWPVVARRYPGDALRVHVRQVLRAGVAMGLRDQGMLLRLLNVSLALDASGGLESVEGAKVISRGAPASHKLALLEALARSEVRRRSV